MGRWSTQKTLDQLATAVGRLGMLAKHTQLYHVPSTTERLSLSHCQYNKSVVSHVRQHDIRFDEAL